MRRLARLPGGNEGENATQGTSLVAVIVNYHIFRDSTKQLVNYGRERISVCTKPRRMKYNLQLPTVEKFESRVSRDNKYLGLDAL